MTTITISYQLSQIGQRAALAAGANAARQQTLVAEMPTDLASAVSLDAEGAATYNLYYQPASGNRALDAPLSADQAIALIRSDAAKRAEIELERAARRATAAAENAATIERILAEARTCPVGDLINNQMATSIYHYHNARHGRLHDYHEPTMGRSVAEAVGRSDEVAAEIGRQLAEGTAASQARRDADAAQREILRAWGRDHGSECLQLMIDLDTGDWVSVADDEYTDAHAPNYGGQKFTSACWKNSGDDSPRKKPTAVELRALKSMRDMCLVDGSVLENPRLLWCEVRAETDDETGDEITAERKFPLLAVDVRVPSRGVTTVAIAF